MLKGKKVNEFPKQFKQKDGSLKLGYMYVYKVHGTQEEIEQYKATPSVAERLDKLTDPDTGEMLFFSPNGSGDQNIDIRIGDRSGKVTEVNDFRASVQKAFIEAKNLGPVAEQALASEYGKSVVTNLFASRRTASAGSIVAPVAQAEPKAVTATPVATAVDDLDDGQ